MGFTDVTLQEHVTADHPDINFEVVSNVPFHFVSNRECFSFETLVNFRHYTDYNDNLSNHELH